MVGALANQQYGGCLEKSESLTGAPHTALPSRRPLDWPWTGAACNFAPPKCVQVRVFVNAVLVRQSRSSGHRCGKRVLHSVFSQTTRNSVWLAWLHVESKEKQARVAVTFGGSSINVASRAQRQPRGRSPAKPGIQRQQLPQSETGERGQVREDR
jgi:hypothetical protein